jgi:hypothetical protein
LSELQSESSSGFCSCDRDTPRGPPLPRRKLQRVRQSPAGPSPAACDLLDHDSATATERNTVRNREDRRGSRSQRHIAQEEFGDQWSCEQSSNTGPHGRRRRPHVSNGGARASLHILSGSQGLEHAQRLTRRNVWIGVPGSLVGNRPASCSNFRSLRRFDTGCGD